MASTSILPLTRRIVVPELLVVVVVVVVVVVLPPQATSARVRTSARRIARTFFAFMFASILSFFCWSSLHTKQNIT